MYKVLFFKRNSAGVILEIPTCQAKSACAQPCEKPGLSMLHLRCHRPQTFPQENKSVQNFSVVGAAISQRENNSFPSFSTWSFWMEMSMGLFFCTFPCFLHRGSSSSRLLGCVFHSHLPCSASALTPGWSGKSMAFSALADPSHLLPVMALRNLPPCSQGFQTSWFVPAVQDLRADWCHHFWTASRFIFVWERSNLFFGRRSDLAWRSEALQFDSRPPKMFVLCSRLNHVPCLSDVWPQW